MVIADLKDPCPACGGHGFQAGFNQYGSFLPNARRTCPTCQGRGFLLSPLGQEVLETLQPFIQEMIHAALRPSSKQAVSAPKVAPPEDQS